MRDAGNEVGTKPLLIPHNQISTIDLMHDDVTCVGVVVTSKSKLAASSASSGGNSKIIVSFDLSESSNKSPEPLLDGPATSEHMSALLPFKFPASGKTMPNWILS